MATTLHPITIALAVGAAARQQPLQFEGNRPDPEADDFYFALKRMLEEAPGRIDPDVLDIAPGNAKRVEELDAQVTAMDAANSDLFLMQARRVLVDVRDRNVNAIAGAGFSAETIAAAIAHIDDAFPT